MTKSKKVQKHKIEKRRLFGLAGIFSLVAILLGGATIAYFRDVDRIVNRIMPANVDVDLMVQQRKVVEGVKTDELETLARYTDSWEELQVMTASPLVGNLEDRDQFGLSNAENYIDRITSVQNNRAVEVYLRAYVVIPERVAEKYGNNEQSILHIDFGTENGVSTEGTSWIWKDDNGNWKTFLVKDSSLYNYEEQFRVYYADYYQTLAPLATSTELIKGLYLDPSLTVAKYGFYLLNDPNGITVYDTSWTSDNTIHCPVYAVAVQAAGFSDATSAFNTAFGENYTPFGSRL